VWSPKRESAEQVAKLARDLDVGDCRAYGSIADMVADPNIDAIWN
jgi:predicted dehydrogenase